MKNIFFRRKPGKNTKDMLVFLLLFFVFYTLAMVVFVVSVA